jgi:hypothetical protein
MKLPSNLIRKDNHYTDVVPRKVLSVWIRSALSHPALSYRTATSSSALFSPAGLSLCIPPTLGVFSGSLPSSVSSLCLNSSKTVHSLLLCRSLSNHILNFALIFASHTSSSNPQQKRTQGHLCSYLNCPKALFTSVTTYYKLRSRFYHRTFSHKLTLPPDKTSPSRLLTPKQSVRAEDRSLPLPGHYSSITPSRQGFAGMYSSLIA